MAPVNNAFFCAILSLHILLVIPFSVHAFSSPTTLPDNPMTTAPNNWTVSLNSSGYQIDATKVYRIIYRTNPTGRGASFAAGFYCHNDCTNYLFSVFIFDADSTGGIVMSSPTVVVWSANRDSPVSEMATLQLTSDSGLSLHDSNGTLVWSTNVGSHSVSGINITESGNLVLFDRNNLTIWQSFDHPTDTLVMGQKLTVGSNLSATSKPQVYLTVVPTGLRAFADQQLYLDCNMLRNRTENSLNYLEFVNGSLSFSNDGDPTGWISFPYARPDSIQYIKLDNKGFLFLYDYINYMSSPNSWDVLEILGRIPDGCVYPTICGYYGIFQDGQCKCADDNYFQKDVNNTEFTFSCSPIIPISCQESQSHTLITIDSVTFYNYIDDIEPRIWGLTVEGCKDRCLHNCSCKAALYSYTNQGCYLSPEIFTLINEQLDIGYFYNSSAYLKVQLHSPSPEKAGFGQGAILGSVFGGLVLLLFTIGALVVLQRGKGKQEPDYIDGVPGLPTRFSFQELGVATENFAKKLGEGGFGTVFEGSLGDEKVAVKRLEGAEQAKKEFLAEVQIIGSIHHINLVRLIGFCAEKSKRFLVYEYMYNGSLNKWIYGRDRRTCLSWRTRYNIIIDIAKGLCYLHEECRQRIVHLDIKPENILLDENFNAKVADFGLCKLIDRNKTKVMTRMRGTPGYLAPEWLTAMITEKVDVYSFGVVVMEILCGRRNLDHSQTEENRHLITLLEEKSKSNQLFDLTDKNVEDFEVHKEEIMHVMELAMWCLQSDCTRRPSMSVVVKVLEGAMEVETSLDYNFVSSIPKITGADVNVDHSVPLTASVLSGPR